MLNSKAKSRTNKKKTSIFKPLSLLLAVLMLIGTLPMGLSVSAAEKHLTEVPSGFRAITTPEQFFAVESNPSQRYILMNDIDMKNTVLSPIGGNYASGYGRAFSGVFDGNGYTIKNVQLSNGYQFYGIFGCVVSGVIKNLRVENVSIQQKAYYGNDVAGTIVGMAEKATIENCHSVCNYNFSVSNSPMVIGGIVGEIMSDSYSEDSAITGCTSSGKISGRCAVSGGIAGATQNTAFSDCSSSVAISNIGTVDTDIAGTGGIVGYAVQGSSIINCSNSGSISSTSRDLNRAIGGISGWLESAGEVSGCVNSGSVSTSGSSLAYAGGIIGGGDLVSVSECLNTGSICATAAAPFVGGLFGTVLADIVSSSANTGAVNCTGVYDDDGEEPAGFAGGLAGGLSGAEDGNIVVSNCYNSGAISMTMPDEFSWRGAGGLCGMIVDSLEFSHCYNYCSFNAPSFYGLAGFISDEAYNTISFTDCYFINTQTKKAYEPTDGVTSSDVSGLSEAKMHKKSSYSGFDFNNIWQISSLGSYKCPTLRCLSSNIEPENSEAADILINYHASATINAAKDGADPAQKINWSTSNGSVAVVSDSGVVTGIGTGTAIITAISADGTWSHSYTVSVRYAWWQWIIRIVLFGWLWY